MAKKAKLTPPILLTREGMEAEITEYFRLQLKQKSLTADMEAEKLKVEARFQERLNAAARDIEMKFASVQNYCVTHRTELLPGDKKSFETTNATVKFYFTPFSVEVRGKEAQTSLAKRLLGLVFNAGTPDEFSCDKYVREPDPQLDKNALLADRATLTEDQLKAMSIRFDQEELFAIEPKSELAEAQTSPVEERKAA